MRSLLGVPWAYEFFQRFSGFSHARKVVLDRFLHLEPGSLILDIGCGPGHICTYLPLDTRYYGFDIDKNYISYANERYGHRGQFFCRVFDADCVNEFGSADIVLLNGVLHHMHDDIAMSTLLTVHQALRPGGKFLSLDGCYHRGQNWIAKKLLDWDRGKFVRKEVEYRKLAMTNFDVIDTHVLENLSVMPYTFIVMIGTRSHKR